MFSAQASGNRGIVESREAAMVRMGSQTPAGSDGTGFELDGERLTLSFAEEDCWFPSDTAMPVGEPGCADFTRQ